MVVGVAGAKVIWDRTQAADVLEIQESAIAAEFSLVNGSGQPVTDLTYRGSWLLVFFGYTNCPDVCPTTLNDISIAMDMLGEAADKVQPLFITIDPERDMPEAMAEYVTFFGDRIIGLSGTPEQIRDTAESFRVFYEKTAPVEGEVEVPGEYLMSHTAATYVISPDGEFVVPFQYGTFPEEMAKRLQVFL